MKSAYEPACESRQHLTPVPSTFQLPHFRPGATRQLPKTNMDIDTASAKPNLPPPQIFDVLPALHELLARIDRAPADSQQQIGSPDDSSKTGDDIGAHYPDQAPFEPKELPTEVLVIKAKIRKALREVEKLPDMDWSVEEQEEEIVELEERIERQKAMLKRFAEMGRASGRG